MKETEKIKYAIECVVKMSEGELDDISFKTLCRLFEDYRYENDREDRKSANE